MDLILQGLGGAVAKLAALDPAVIDAAVASLVVSGAATTIAVITGVPLGTVIGLTQFRGRRLLLSLVNTGMGQTLQIASEKLAYTITDRATYLSQKSHIQLDVLNGGDPPLLNYYHVITVSPKKFPKVNRAGANAFADYLVHPDTQKLIATFGLDKFGQQLFFPDAGKPDPSG